jgi:hypothetical protein
VGRTAKCRTAYGAGRSLGETRAHTHRCSNRMEADLSRAEGAPVTTTMRKSDCCALKALRTSIPRAPRREGEASRSSRVLPTGWLPTRPGTNQNFGNRRLGVNDEDAQVLLHRSILDHEPSPALPDGPDYAERQIETRCRLRPGN